MRMLAISLVVALPVLCAGQIIRVAAEDQPDALTLRIGTYDSRAIAIAIAPTEHSPSAKLQQQYQTARKAGDKQQMANLSDQINAMQRKFHRMGFARVPVDELLEPVKDKLPAVAKKAGVDAIVFDCNWAGEGVEVIDVTDELVALFEPSDKVLGWIEQLKDTPPVDLDVLEAHGHEH